MPSLTIKDLPDPLWARLRQRAAADRRSLNREVIHLLDRVLAEGSAAPVAVALTEQIEAQVRAWQTLAGRWDSDREPAEEIDALYAARTPGRRVEL
jgi:plasmid stability protein